MHGVVLHHALLLDELLLGREDGDAVPSMTESLFFVLQLEFFTILY